MSQDKSPPDMLDDARNSMNFVVVVARIWAISLEVFLHRQVGSRYPGLLGALVIIFIPIFGCFWKGHRLDPLLTCLMFYLVMCVAHRICVVRRMFTASTRSHSFYNGRPLLCEVLPTWSECQIKLIVEPTLVGLLGACFLSWNAPLAYYLMGGAASLFLSNALSVMFYRQQVLDMADAYLEQKVIAEQFRDLHGS